MLNEILGAAARYNALLTRKFNITGGAPAPQLTPEIGTSLDIDAGPEGRILTGEFLASGFMSQTAGAVQSAAVALNNTVPGLLVILEQIVVMTTAPATVFGSNIGVGVVGVNPNLPVAGTQTFRDTRVTQGAAAFYTRSPSARMTGATNTPPTVLVANLARTLNAVNVPYVYDKPVCIANGWAVQVNQIDQVGTLLVWMAWREIPLAPGEVGPF